MTVIQSVPRAQTWETLQNSRNLAAVAALAGGLSSADAELRSGCIRGLMGRKEPEGRRALLLAWENFTDQDRELLKTKSSQFAAVTCEMLASGTLSQKRLALEVVAALELTESLDAVLDLVIDAKHALCPQASIALLAMCEHWGQQARIGKDSASVRGKMLESLYSRLAVFHEHKNVTLVDAWLCLVHWDDSLQRNLIADPRQSAHRCVMQRLKDCARWPVIQLLAGYLGRSTTPQGLVALLTERPEVVLAIEIAKLLEQHKLYRNLKRLQELPPLRCLHGIENELEHVGIEIQRRIWLMVAASSEDLRQVLSGSLKLAKLGTKEARGTAAEMLRLCRRPDLEELVPAIQAAEVEALESSDELVLGVLIKDVANWLQSPSITLKKAAREFFQDFTVDNLLDQIRTWPTQMCRAMAGIVAQVDPDVTEKLTSELQSPAPKRRLAALQAIQLLDCAEQVSQALMPLWDDPRLEVRVRAIDLLGALGHGSLEELIPLWLADASTDIQDAAGRVVRRLQRQEKLES